VRLDSIDARERPLNLFNPFRRENPLKCHKCLRAATNTAIAPGLTLLNVIAQPAREAAPKDAGIMTPRHETRGGLYGTRYVTPAECLQFCITCNKPAHDRQERTSIGTRSRNVHLSLAAFAARAIPAIRG